VSEHRPQQKRPIKVRFRGLKPHELGGHKSVCPCCVEGLLLVSRDPRTLELLPWDCCTLCGQEFVYLDIEDVRENGGHL
jgi:hypothetical protein